MRYCIKRICEKTEIEQCNRFDINHYMWNSKVEPKTYGWAGYLENEGIYVKIVCEEENPKREYQNHKDMVCEDSTVEIFMAFPKENEALTNDSMYLNFEINSNGAMYAKYGKGRKNRTFLSEDEYEKTRVKGMIQKDRWSAEVLIPEEFLNEICEFEKVKNGTVFYCNFYKISESKEIEHYGSYSPIDNPTPNFHLPVYFAEAVIE